jgi:hypothetical protein
MACDFLKLAASAALFASDCLYSRRRQSGTAASMAAINAVNTIASHTSSTGNEKRIETSLELRAKTVLPLLMLL